LGAIAELARAAKSMATNIVVNVSLDDLEASDDENILYDSYPRTEELECM
jgi:uncharacterized protein YbjQ (UPF0145 family)